MRLMPRKIKPQPASTNVLDYPEGMSQYEKESLAAEATLRSERKKKKLLKSAKPGKAH
jgi:hypothetical protein